MRCRYCAGVIKLTVNGKWWHVKTARYSCVDLMGTIRKARPT